MNVATSEQIKPTSNTVFVQLDVYLNESDCVISPCVSPHDSAGVTGGRKKMTINKSVPCLQPFRLLLFG